jgi:hypothetical protein
MRGIGLATPCTRRFHYSRGMCGCQQFESVEIFALGGRIVMRVGKLKS